MMSRPELIEVLADDFGWPREYLMGLSFGRLWNLLSGELKSLSE